MLPVACRPVQALLLSGFKYFPLRCFVAAAPAPLLLHRLLHLPIRTSAYFNYPLRSEHSRCLFYSRHPHSNMAADGAVEVAVSQDAILSKRMQSKLEAIGIMGNDWRLGMALYLPCSKDTKFQFLWNCKAYLEKASRIILATDADAPGQALAEELARRLGRERCLRVKWPKKDATEVCKDANELSGILEDVGYTEDMVYKF